MKWVADIKHPKPLHCEIEKQLLRSILPGKPDQDGFYLFVYDNGVNTHDYLQDSLEMAMDQALDDFGIPKSAWRKVE
jgi:hypothetical protein